MMVMYVFMTSLIGVTVVRGLYKEVYQQISNCVFLIAVVRLFEDVWCWIGRFSP